MTGNTNLKLMLSFQAQLTPLYTKGGQGGFIATILKSPCKSPFSKWDSMERIVKLMPLNSDFDTFFVSFHPGPVEPLRVAPAELVV